MNLKSIKYLSIFLLLLAFAFMDVRAEGGDKKNNTLNKITGAPVYKKFNINRISTYFKNDGESDINPNGNSGFEYPRRSGKTAIFQAGLVWGGKVNGQIRVGGSSYRQGTVPGKILNSGVPATQLIGEDSNLDNVRCYRVRPDYLTGSVQAEIDDDEGSESEVRAAYERDWNDWPAADGAPFEDVDGNGLYDPTVDIPGVPGADQTIWFVCNDTDPNQSQFMYGSLPMGIEEQVTVWGYNSAGPLGSMLFRKFKIINKSDTDITDMYVSMWNDPDLGDATDDFAGCDTTLSLAFVYNANPVDQIYGSNPAAAGFDFFQGPIVDGEPTDTAIFNGEYVIGKKNLGMTAHYFYINPDAVYRDPTQGQYQGTQEWYNFMQGRVGTTGDIFPDPFTGGTTVFALYGDPVAGTGWLDGQQHPPGDRRAGMASGPFTMAAGDTQEVVVAEIAAQGSSNINSVSLLKAYDKVAQDAYDKFFVLPSPPAVPVASGVGLDQQVVLNWGYDLARVDETESLNREKFTFQGYNVYQLLDPTKTKDDIATGDVVRITTFDIIDNIKAVKDRIVDPVSGEEEIVVKQFGGDYGIERSFTIDKNYLTNSPLNNGSRYYFAVTSYAIYNQSGEPDPVQVPNNLENTFIVMTVVPQSTDPGVTYGEDPGSELEVDHYTGLADGAPFVNVVDPSATTGHQYELFFTSRQEIRNANGDWVPASLIKRSHQPNDPDTLTGSSIDISAIYPSLPSMPIELHFYYNYVSVDDNWTDGIELDIEPGITIVDFPSFEAGGGTIDPVITGDPSIGYHIEMGDVTGILSEDGIFHGGEEWLVYVELFTPPKSVDWVCWDDGYSGGYLNAEGTTTIEEIGFVSRTALYWNVKDLDANVIKLENQPVVDGVSLYPRRDDLPTGFGTNSAQVADGFEIGVLGSYDAPITPFDYSLNEGSTSRIGTGSSPSATRTVFNDYTLFGLPTSWVIDAFGVGSTNLDTLQQDIEIRYTGILDTTVVTDPGGNIDTLITVASGGQMASVFGTVQGAANVRNHPFNPSPGTNAAFLLRIPIEVWNKDENRQLNVAFRDREQALPTDTTADKFFSWNPNARNYMCVINSDYDETKIVPVTQDPTDPENAFATWVVVWYSTRLVVGDVVTISYANPFQIGVDTYRFTTTASAYSNDLAADDINKINVFPNPYYGVNPQEINKYERFVTINHLPDFATIRVFNLAGQLVRTIEKTDPGQFQRWDLTTDSGLPVASGLYIIYVDMPELGRTKILKAAIIQEQQILDRF
jgi:hypothetical protein